MPRVKLFATLRTLAGLKETSVPGARLGEVLAGLEQAHPALAGRLVQDGQLRPHVVVTINGQTTQELRAPVASDDEIAIFPPVAGG